MNNYIITTLKTIAYGGITKKYNVGAKRIINIRDSGDGTYCVFYDDDTFVHFNNMFQFEAKYEKR